MASTGTQSRGVALEAASSQSWSRPLTSSHRACGRWLICGDAIADPFTGLHAALAAQASWLGGGGHLLSLSLSGTVRHAIAFATGPAR